MNLNDVHRGIQKNKKRKRIGRGPGTGHGKMSGRGEKGQKSRSGWSQRIAFQGGAMPMIRRIPKRGFFNKFAETVVAVNVRDLERCFNSGDEVNAESMIAKSLIPRRHDEIKVLGDGELSAQLTVSAHRFSASAKDKIEKAGGTCVVLAPKTPVESKKGKGEPQGETSNAEMTSADASPADEPAAQEGAAAEEKS